MNKHNAVVAGLAAATLATALGAPAIANVATAYAETGAITQRAALAQASLSAKAHVQNKGWLAQTTAAVGKSVIAGTSGEGLRLEALTLSVTVPNVTDEGEVETPEAPDTSETPETPDVDESEKDPDTAPDTTPDTGDADKGDENTPDTGDADTGDENTPGNGGEVEDGSTSDANNGADNAEPGEAGEAASAPAAKAATGASDPAGVSAAAEAAEDATTYALTGSAYVSHVGWVESDAAGTLGTTGKGARLQAVRFTLPTEVSSAFDLYYRVHVENVGWLPWASNGEATGYTNKALRIEAVELVLMPKGEAPSWGTAGTSENASVRYQEGISLLMSSHVENLGWGDTSANATSANETLTAKTGTTGRGLRMEAITLDTQGLDLEGNIEYATHVENYGWGDWEANGNVSGTQGQGLRIEALKVRLTGQLAERFDVYYRVHAQNVGWMKWVKNGEVSGTESFGLRLESIEVMLVPKGGTAPKDDASSSSYSYIAGGTATVSGYVNGTGWVGGQNVGGTTGQGKALGAITLGTTGDNRPTGSISSTVQYTTGNWSGWTAEGGHAGDTSNNMQLQAVQIALNGDLAGFYDVWYRAHVSNLGWLGWTSNGQTAGTSGIGCTIEAVEVVLRPKGSGAPGSTSGAYVDESVGKLGWQNPSGYYQVSTKTVTLPAAAYSTPFSYVTPSRIGIWASRQDCINAFVQRAWEYVGTPYVWNYSRQVGVGVDCIGLVYQCAYATGMDMGEFNPYNHWYSGTNGWHSHDAMNVWNYGKIQRLSFSQRQYGDLIFYPGHVAIYIGNNQIIEASSISGKVVVSSVYRYSTIYGVGRLYV
jgi:uncharacterized protein YjdB